MRVLLALTLTLAACQASPPPPQARPVDPESVAVDFLTEHLFDPPDQLRATFTPRVRAEAFPLRSAVQDPAHYTFVDIWRIRSLDGRRIIEALVTLNGQPHTQLFWLEQAHDDRWQIAGWDPQPQPVDPGGAAPTAGITVPRTFAAPLLRGTQATPILPVHAPAVAAAHTSRFKAAVQLTETSGQCGAKGRLKNGLSAVGPAVAACAAAVEGRGGRLSFKVALDGDAGTTQATLVETTLLDDALRRCALAAFAALPVALGPGQHCAAQVRITLRLPR
jgi:hypothetical protein